MRKKQVMTIMVVMIMVIEFEHARFEELWIKCFFLYVGQDETGKYQMSIVSRPLSELKLYYYYCYYYYYTDTYR